MLQEPYLEAVLMALRALSLSLCLPLSLALSCFSFFMNKQEEQRALRPRTSRQRRISAARGVAL